MFVSFNEFVFSSPTVHMDEDAGRFRSKLQDLLQTLYLHINNNLQDVNVADYNACHLQTSFKLYKRLCCVNLKHIPSIFPFTSLCFLWLPSFFHSQAGGSDWISHEVLSLHFSQTPASAFLFSLQFCSLGLQLWHCQSVGVIPQKAGKVRCRDEERLLSHISWCITWNAGPVWVAQAATHTHTTPPFPILHGAAAFESEWRTCWLTHCYPEPFDPSSLARGHSSTEKTFHMSWLEQNNVYALHSTTTWSIYAHASLTHKTHTSCVVFSASSLMQWESDCNSSTCWYINPMTSTQQPHDTLNPPTNERIRFNHLGHKVHKIDNILINCCIC